MKFVSVHLCTCVYAGTHCQIKFSLGDEFKSFRNAALLFLLFILVVYLLIVSLNYPLP